MRCEGEVMANFEDIDEARKLLGLSETATLKEIKSAYRRLAHEYHPDKQDGASESGEQRMKKINWAYQLLVNYCQDYKYSFREEDIAKTYPHDEYLRKFHNGWFEGI
jgi:DnaJ-class molecular chaperone